MAWPYGGNLTHAELAQKFGWPSVIISILTLPAFFLFSRLLAFPVFLCRKWKPVTLKDVITYSPQLDKRQDVHWKYFLKNRIRYVPREGSEIDNRDLFRNKVYFSLENELLKVPTGWNCYIDKEGGKFFESFWGIINCLDYVDEDPNDVGFEVRPNHLSWLIALVFVEFQHDPTHEHTVRFFFPLGGWNAYNPFAWLTMLYVATALTCYGKYSFVPFKEHYNVKTTSDYKIFPNEIEDQEFASARSLGPEPLAAVQDRTMSDSSLLPQPMPIEDRVTSDRPVLSRFYDMGVNILSSFRSDDGSLDDGSPDETTPLTGSN